MQEQIFKELEKIGVKFSKIEVEVGMPSNYLSRFKNPVNKLPEKWIEPLRDFIKKHTNSDQPEAAPNPKTKLVVEGKNIKEKPSDEATKRLSLLRDKLNKDYGEGSVMMLGEMPATSEDAISTGSYGLDKALGIGGLPRGRIVEIYGPEASGKTTIAIHVIAEAQRKGLKCMLIDAEHAFDPEYAKSLGVKIEDLLISQPDYGEQALEIADQYICGGDIGVMVIDSVAALIPKAELEGEMGDSKMGLHARLMSQACRKMTANISRTNTLCIFINQLRNKIGVIYGSPEVTTGGMALQFYASVRIDIRRQAKIIDGEIQIGNKTKAKVVKNKCAPPFRTAEFDVIYGEGINKVGEILDAATDLNIVVKSGSWYAFKTDKLGQGRESVIQLLKDNPELYAEILKELELKN